MSERPKRDDVRRALAVFKRSIRRAEIQPVPPITDWAPRARVLPGDVTAKPGPFDFDRTPWMREPSDAVDDPSVEMIVLCLAARLGKTELLLNLIGRTIDADPKNILMVYPDLDKAKKWNSMFFQPMVESSPVFRGKVSDPKRRDGDNTALSKKYAGGRLIAVGAQSPSSFRQVQAPVILCDEIDAYPVTAEGSAVQLAMKRAENYEDAVKVIASTPTDEDTSQIWRALEESDFRKWHCLSPRTGRFVVVDWEHLRWEEGKPETACIHDPDTGEPWTHEEFSQAIRSGKWVATKPFNGTRGYWANGMISLFGAARGCATKCHQFAKEFLKAKSLGKDALKVWTNTFRALAWRDVAEEMDWEAVRDRACEYDTEIPEQVRFLTVGVDKQRDRVELEVVGWGDDFASWGIGYHVFQGDTEQRPVWQKVEEFLRQECTHPSGMKMRVARVFVDEGDKPQMVRAVVKDWHARGIEAYPCKGIGRSGETEPDIVTFDPKRKQKGIRAPTFNVGSSKIKRTIYAHLLTDDGPNAQNWPTGRGYDDRYFQMLTVERIVTRFLRGQPVKEFLCPNGARNEALDCRVYAYAAAYSLNPSWDHLAKKVSKSWEQSAPPVKFEREPALERPQSVPELPVSKPEIRQLTEPSEQPIRTRRRSGPMRGGWVSNF